MTSPLDDLRWMGDRLGGVLWVQGPGGNISVKTEQGELLVKASGKRLKDIGADSSVARVELDVALQALNGNSSADKLLFDRSPRPSLETYFHALPGRIVAHTHSIGVLLLACSTVEILGVLNDTIIEIPYIRPGRGLAQAIRSNSNGNASERVFLLRNHGLVVMSSDAERAVSITENIDGSIREKLRTNKPFEPMVASYLEGIRELDAGFARYLPKRKSLHAQAQYLFPDATVYASVVQVKTGTDFEAVAPDVLNDLKRSFIVVDDTGNRYAVAESKNQLDDACAILAAHDYVEDTLSTRGVANYLPASEPSNIVNMPSEQYRIRLESSRQVRC